MIKQLFGVKVEVESPITRINNLEALLAIYDGKGAGIVHEDHISGQRDLVVYNPLEKEFLFINLTSYSVDRITALSLLARIANSEDPTRGRFKFTAFNNQEELAEILKIKLPRKT